MWHVDLPKAPAVQLPSETRKLLGLREEHGYPAPDQLLLTMNHKGASPEDPSDRSIFRLLAGLGVHSFGMD